MIATQRARLALLLAAAPLMVGCNGDAPDGQAGAGDPFYTYGPILSAATPSQRLPLEAPRIPLPDGTVPQRDLRVTELFLVCWPTADWPDDVQPQVSLHPAGDPEERRVALAARPPSRDRLTYDVPSPGALIADAAFVELPSAIGAQCPDVVFGARGTIRTPERDEPEKSDDEEPGTSADDEPDKAPEADPAKPIDRTG